MLVSNVAARRCSPNCQADELGFAAKVVGAGVVILVQHRCLRVDETERIVV